MIKPHHKILLLIICCFTSFLSFGQASDASINKIIDLTGLSKQINQFPGLVKAGMEQAKLQGTPIPEAEYNAIQKSVDESILPFDILEGIRHSLKKSITEEEAQELLAWYESDLGKEITMAEEKASTAEAYNEMMKEAELLVANTERVEMAKRLDILLGATDMTMNIQENTSIAIYSAIMLAMQPGTPLNLDPIRAQMDASRTQSRAANHQMVIIAFVYSYKTIDDKKLKKYEAFLNRPTVVKFNKTIMTSLKSGLETSISKWADEVAIIFKNSKQ